MSRACLVTVLLCALLPLRGLAQAPSPPPMVPAPAPPAQEPGAAPGAGEKEISQDEIIPRQPREPETAGRRAGRIALETLGGALGGFIGGVPGIGLSIAFSLCEGCSDADASVIAGLAGVAGFTAGTAFGVWGVGSLMGGKGRYWPTLAGTGLGILFGGGLAVLLATQVDESLAIPPLIAGPFMGTVIAYEISHVIELERGAEDSASIAVLPTVSVRPSGGFVAGLVGRF